MRVVSDAGDNHGYRLGISSGSPRRRPAVAQPVQTQIDGAEQLALDTAQEQVVVVAQPPAHAADPQHLGRFLTTRWAYRLEEAPLQLATTEALMLVAGPAP